MRPRWKVAILSIHVWGCDVSSLGAYGFFFLFLFSFVCMFVCLFVCFVLFFVSLFVYFFLRI